MYLLTFKKVIPCGGSLQQVGHWEVVGQSSCKHRVGALKAKARYEDVVGQCCDVRKLNVIRSINLDVTYLEETML